MTGFWDAVASAGPYANNLHLVPDRQPRPLQAGDAVPDAQPSVSKHNSHYIPQKQQLCGEVTVVLCRNAVALKRVVGD